MNLSDGQSRDGQYYRVHLCSTWNEIRSEEELKKLKDHAFEDMQAEQIAAAEGRAARFARLAKDKAEDLADDVKHRSADFARRARSRSGRVGSTLKQKAEEGVKEGASKATKGLFWKALGY